MPTRSSKKRLTDAEISRVAAAMGRIGGPKGGRARAEKLTAEERSDIARRAAEKRWKKKG